MSSSGDRQVMYVPEVYLELGGGPRGDGQAPRATQLDVELGAAGRPDRQATFELRHVYQTDLLLKKTNKQHFNMYLWVLV